MNVRLTIVVGLAGVLLAAPAADGQTVVAKVRVENVTDQPMTGAVVRGHLPLPARYDKPVAGLALRDGEKTISTQVNVFSTYPGSDDEYPLGRPEIVQLAGRVDLPAKGFKEFDVIQLDKAPQPAAAAPAGKALSKALAVAETVVFEAVDCFNNRYRTKVLDDAALIDTRQAGPVMTVKVYQSPLKPIGAAEADKPALKQMLNVRAYLTTYAGEDFASLAVMVHNGSIDNPNGDVYYRELRLGIAKPLGLDVWRKRTSSAADEAAVESDGYTWQPCPSAPPQGKVFVMPHRAAAVLRTTIFAPEVKGRALQIGPNSPVFIPTASLELLSWSNWKTARYGASKYPMPLRLDQPVLDKQARRLGGALANPGIEYLRKAKSGASRKLGHAMPAGVRYGGMTGGTGVQYVFGVYAAVSARHDAITGHVLKSDRNWDRQWVHRFYDDGKPYTHSRHVVVVNGQKVLDIPLNKSSWPKEVYKDPAVKVHAKFVNAGAKDPTQSKLASKGRELKRYMSHDDQHLSRVFDAIAAAYLACDPLSRDRLLTLGGYACSRLNIYGYRSKPHWGGFGSLLAVRKGVDKRPGKGVGFGRANGWLNHALAAAFYLSTDKLYRQDCIDVAKFETEIREKAQMPGGNVTIHRPYSKSFKGEYWYVNAWQTVGIMGDGARCLTGILSSPADQEYADRLKRVYAKVGRWSATVGWDEKLNCPAGDVALRRKGSSEWLETPKIPNLSRAHTTHYYGSPYMWYYEITGDELFLKRIKQMAGRGGVLKAAQGYSINDWSYILWCAQGGAIPGRKPLTAGSGE